jgi:hypothetical protein
MVSASKRFFNWSSRGNGGGSCPFSSVWEKMRNNRSGAHAEYLKSSPLAALSPKARFKSSNDRVDMGSSNSGVVNPTLVSSPSVMSNGSFQKPLGLETRKSGTTRQWSNKRMEQEDSGTRRQWNNKKVDKVSTGKRHTVPSNTCFTLHLRLINL